MRMFLIIVPPILIVDFLAVYFRDAQPLALILSNIILILAFSAIYIYAVEPIIKRMQNKSKEEK